MYVFLIITVQVTVVAMALQPTNDICKIFSTIPLWKGRRSVEQRLKARRWAHSHAARVLSHVTLSFIFHPAWIRRSHMSRRHTKPDQTDNKLKANFILTKTVHQKAKLETRFIKITQCSNNIIITCSKYRLGSNWYTMNTHRTYGNPKAQKWWFKARTNPLTKDDSQGYPESLTNRARTLKDSPEDIVAHQKARALNLKGFL